MTRRYFGSPGHFIGADECHFHLATEVNGYLVSTVGEYRPRPSDQPQTIGVGRLYETMVFKAGATCECGCGMPTHDGSEIDFAGYNSRIAANEGHEALCVKYESTPATTDARR